MNVELKSIVDGLLAVIVLGWFSLIGAHLYAADKRHIAASPNADSALWFPIYAFLSIAVGLLPLWLISLAVGGGVPLLFLVYPGLVVVAFSKTRVPRRTGNPKTALRWASLPIVYAAAVGVLAWGMQVAA
jgi:hypothetical protein